MAAQRSRPPSTCLSRCFARCRGRVGARTWPAEPALFGSASNRWGKTPLMVLLPRDLTMGRHDNPLLAPTRPLTLTLTLTRYSEAGWAGADFDMLSFDMSKAPGRAPLLQGLAAVAVWLRALVRDDEPRRDSQHPSASTAMHTHTHVSTHHQRGQAPLD